MNAILAEAARNDLIVRQWNAALVHLSIATLVDEFADRFEGGITIRDVRLHILQHLQDGLVHLQEHAVVQLLQTKQLEHLSGLGAQFDDADNASNEQKLGVWL